MNGDKRDEHGGLGESTPVSSTGPAVANSPDSTSSVPTDQNRAESEVGDVAAAANESSVGATSPIRLICLRPQGIASRLTRSTALLEPTLPMVAKSVNTPQTRQLPKPWTIGSREIRWIITVRKIEHSIFSVCPNSKRSSAIRPF